MHGVLLSEIIQMTISGGVANQIGGKAIGWTEVVGAIGGAVGAVTGIVAIILAAKAWGTSKTQLRQQIYHDLMSEYRTPLMLKALSLIGKLKNEDKNIVAAEYRAMETTQEVLVGEGKLREEDQILSSRRLVYQYYHQIALTAEGDDAFKQLVYRIWTKKSLDILPKAIIPIELDSENEGRDINQIELRDYPSSLKRLQKLYDDAPD